MAVGPHDAALELVGPICYRPQSRTAPWLNWIEQPPPKGQVAGSNPAGVTKPAIKVRESI